MTDAADAMGGPTCAPAHHLMRKSTLHAQEVQGITVQQVSRRVKTQITGMYSLAFARLERGMPDARDNAATRETRRVLRNRQSMLCFLLVALMRIADIA